MIVDKMPSAVDFYKNYWGKKPFIVRGAVDTELFDDLIDGDELAGLSLEEDIKSRIVINDPIIECHHGPFAEDRFADLGDSGWSLLVQNVEIYHKGTEKLLQYFDFAPLWFLDDIMVSYSAAGGGVGAHTDSYHVFLVQGKGKRKWKISNAPVYDDNYIENIDLKILKNGFDGEEFETSKGDVIYIPPHFGHEGVSIEEAMTFSVGFLCPKLSEMLIEYGYYLDQIANNDDRYCGQGLDEQSSSFTISPAARKTIKNELLQLFDSDDFYKWLAHYFSRDDCI